MHRRLAALLLGTVGLLAVAASPAAGQTAGSSAPANTSGALTAAPADGSPVDGASGGFALIVEPGKSANHTIVVRNGTADRRLSVRIVPVDGTRGNDGVRYATKATKEGSGAWVTPTVGVVVVEPGASADVPFAVEVPRDAAAGDAAVAGLRVFAERATDLAGAAAATDDVPTLTVPIGVQVPGAPAPRLAVTSVVAAEKDGATHLAVTVRNSGSVVADAAGAVRSPGGELTRGLSVRVEPRKEITKLVEWQTIDVARGADVAVELEYGNGDTATWVGVVGADPNFVPPTVAPPDTQAPAGSQPAPGAPAPRPGGEWLGIFVALVVFALMIAAAAWLVSEVMRGRRPASMPIDPAAFPTLQVMMDPRHTDVLNALVTQVGALGGAIGQLAEKIGVTVAIPTPPPQLLPTIPGRRHRDPARPRHAPNAEPVANMSERTSERMSERMASTRAGLRSVGPPQEDLPQPSRQEVADAIVSAVEGVSRPPVLIPPPLSADWIDEDLLGAVGPPEPPVRPPVLITPPPALSDEWPSDAEVEAFLHRRAGEAPKDALSDALDAPIKEYFERRSEAAPNEVAPGPEDSAWDAFFQRRADDVPNDFLSDRPDEDDPPAY